MPLSFTCPCCRAHLKVRDESFIGTTLNCPDCRTPLQVVKTDTDEIACRVVTEQPAEVLLKASSTGQRTASKTRSPSAHDPDPEAFQSIHAMATGSRTPQVVAWTVAGVCLLALIPFLLPASKPQVGDPAPLPAGKQEAAAAPAQTAVVQQQPAPKKEAEPKPLSETAQGRLEELGRLVLEQAKNERQFPSGTVPAADLDPAQRWSWLAKIAARDHNPNALPVAWNRPWNDPSQDPFVRRSIPRFQNPAIPIKASEDKYPATHFVGVAGVGPDAPTLPVDHPRAGIFGQDRQTKLDQIRDGASNTMLLAGAENQLGSWAAGTSSYRAFTREPYIHGPDGFGTGEPDSMLVLMADGSVRTISKQTDPRIVRRLAAMSDGLPLDEKITGEPGDPKPETLPMPHPQVAKANPPVKPEETVKPPVLAPAEQVIDIPAALSKKILKFDQTKPAAAFQMLLQIEELSGVRIEYDRAKLGENADRLDKLVTLKKDNASLQELLNEVLKQIGLQQQNDKTCIRIVAPRS